jgi:hypothetical protein
MTASGFLDQAFHPLPAVSCVRMEIESNRQSVSQQVDDMRRHGLSQALRKSHEVLERAHFFPEQAGEPRILLHKKGIGPRREPTRQRRLS